VTHPLFTRLKKFIFGPVLQAWQLYPSSTYREWLTVLERQ